MKSKLAKLPSILDMSDNIYDSVWAENFHKNSDYELLHVISGSFELTYADGRHFPAKAGDTLLIAPGVLHRDIFENELEIFIVHFSWDIDQAEIEHFNNSWNLKQDVETKMRVRYFFDCLRMETLLNETSFALVESILLSILLTLFSVTSSNKPLLDIVNLSPKQQHQQLLLRAKKYIHRHFRETIQLIDVAHYLQVSSFHLSRIFSRESDFSFIDYLTEIRLNEAKRLLQSGRYKVREIAFHVGYNDEKYFNRLFKKHTGCTPTEYAQKQNYPPIGNIVQ